jgi:hypothetical protein
VERKTALRRKTGLKQRPRDPQKRRIQSGRLTFDDHRAIWHRGIMGLRCQCCAKRPAMDAHHIIPVQVLRRMAATNGYDFEVVRWDNRNRLGLCRQCHGDHHSGKAKLPKSLLWRKAPLVFKFAEQYGLSNVIDRYYLDA